MQIYVGNLPASYTDDDLRKMFEAHGKVRSAVIGKNKKTGESEGYGFVEMPVKSEGRAAIETLRGKQLEGKPLLVRALKPGDEFHQHAVNMQNRGGGKLLPRAMPGNLGPRGAGAIRRGGQRGT